jgi:hypothetical protein
LQSKFKIGFLSAQLLPPEQDAEVKINPGAPTLNILKSITYSHHGILNNSL